MANYGIIKDTTLSSIAGFIREMKNEDETHKYIPATFEPELRGIITQLSNRIDPVYRAMVYNAESKTDIDTLFVEWWDQVYTDGADKANLLNRWFGNVLVDTRVHGAKLPLFETSESSIGELTGDSAGLVCEPSTATVAGRDDFARLPQFWILEVAGDKNADGTCTINKIQHIDNLNDVRSGNYGLCQVLTKNTYYKEWHEDGYHYWQQQCADFDGASRWIPANAQGVAYEFAAFPKYMAGYGPDGIITCGTGLKPVIRTSMSAGVDKWRARSAMYAGGTFRLPKWQLAMFALKYARKGNSGLIEGCSNYDCQYNAAISETGVKRILLAKTQAANLLVGSSASLGTADNGSKDRSRATTYAIGDCLRITAIEDVEIDGTVYGAVYVDSDDVFDTQAGATLLNSMPHRSGWNDGVLGNDGARINPVGTQEAGLIQGTEFGIGAYHIVADEFIRVTRDADNHCLTDIFICPDQSKVHKSSITADYRQLADATFTFDVNVPYGWRFVQDMRPCETNWPVELSKGTGNSTGYRAAFYVDYFATIRASWCFVHMLRSGYCGLAARTSDTGPNVAAWYGASGVPSITG